jgi:hypothetical protein
VDVASVLEEELLHSRQLDLHNRYRAHLQKPGVELFDQGLGRSPPETRT